MELKDKLKQLRKEKGLTQAQLADAIFVSRSTVAKWENGLGLPSPESMTALEQLFAVETQQITTTEPETVIVEKNRKLHLIGSIIGWTAVIVLLVYSMYLPFALHEGNYGFTWDMAAGVFADDTYFDTGDYRIYYHVFEGDWDDGRHWYSLSTFRPVEKHLWGFTVSEEDYESDVILYNYRMVGKLYCIKGKNGYYNIIKNVVGEGVPDFMVTIESVTIQGIEYEVQNGVFFITPEPVEYFKIGDFFLNVE
jgi:transcriptional regulator with XRE-family HTH domain